MGDLFLEIKKLTLILICQYTCLIVKTLSLTHGEFNTDSKDTNFCWKILHGY